MQTATHLSLQRAERIEAAARTAAYHKVERIRAGHSAQLASLGESTSEAYRKGRVIEQNIASVEAACLVLRSGLEHGVDWGVLTQHVAEEAAAGNPVARLVRG